MRNLARSGVGSLLLLATFVAACGGGGSSSNPSTSNPSTGGPGGSSPGSSGAAGGVPGPLQDPVALRINVFANVTHAPGLIATAENGPLRKLLPNADITVTTTNSGTGAVEQLFADAIDITYIGPNPALNAYTQSNGEAVRVVAGSTSGGAFLVVRDDIDSAEDLRGKKVASPNLGNTQDVALRAWLKEQGLSTDTAGGGDVSVVPQENSLTLETFQAGTIDGAWVPEPWATRLIDEGGAKILVDERDLWPEGEYVTTHLMVATKYLEANPEVVKRVILATIEAVDFANENPDEAQAITNAEIEKWTSQALSEDLLAKSWANLKFTVDPIASSLAKSAEDAQALGLLEDPGDLAGLYDLTFLNEILAGLGRDPVSGL